LRDFPSGIVEPLLVSCDLGNLLPGAWWDFCLVKGKTSLWPERGI